ncbi:MAG: nuclear transport factor 2 family protein, partial [Rhizobiales bacterium]|nr:nuclear transport factor 2 family protein [Hyphomicrobiales bacterium]
MLALITGVYAQGGGNRPRQFSTGSLQAYPQACKVLGWRLSRRCPQPVDAAGEIAFGRFMSNDAASAAAIQSLIQDWGFARDQGRWEALEAIFHPDGEIAVSWFRGPYSEFVAHCRRNHGRGSTAKHLLWPSRIAVKHDRATAETNVAILVRQT